MAKRTGIDPATGAAQTALRAAGHPALLPGGPRAVGDLILGGGSFADLADGRTQRYVFASVDFSGRRVGLVATGFLPHGVAIDPLNPHRVVTFEKIGPGCCEIDLAEGARTREISPTDDRWFYGHGAFSADGKLLYSTETVNSKGRGVIGVRDASSLDYLGEFPTHGENPHDCHLIEDGKVLVVTNGGGPLGTPQRGCVTYVDVGSQRLLEKREIEDERFNAGHFCLSKAGTLVVVSAPRKGLTDKELGAVSMRRGKDALRTMTDPDGVASRMMGEALSVEVHEPAGIAAVTHPLGTMVTFWSLDRLEFVKAIELPRVRGLTLTRDGRYFVVSYGVTAEVALIDPETLELVPGSSLSQSFLTGSHLFNWSRLAPRN